MQWRADNTLRLMELRSKVKQYQLLNEEDVHHVQQSEIAEQKEAEMRALGIQELEAAHIDAQEEYQHSLVLVTPHLPSLPVVT